MCTRVYKQCYIQTVLIGAELTTYWCVDAGPGPHLSARLLRLMTWCTVQQSSPKCDGPLTEMHTQACGKCDQSR